VILLCGMASRTVKASQGPRYRVEALAKGLRVLRAFSAEKPRLRLGEAADIAGLPISTTYRMLKTLAAEGYVEELPDDSFRPTAAVLRLGVSSLQRTDLIEAADPALARLAETTQETVNLGILIGAEVLFVRRIRSADFVSATLRVGSLIPAACASIGKLLLAFLQPVEQVERLQAINLSGCRGPRSIKNIEALSRELREIREVGWAVQDEEYEYGIRSIAAPIRDDTATVVAGLNIAVTASKRSVQQLIDELLPQAQRAADEVSRNLGFEAEGMAGLSGDGELISRAVGRGGRQEEV
jgi:IclR family transcriptional regulator, pca regulon regulatory protein